MEEKLQKIFVVVAEEMDACDNNQNVFVYDNRQAAMDKLNELKDIAFQDNYSISIRKDEETAFVGVTTGSVIRITIYEQPIKKQVESWL